MLSSLISRFLIAFVLASLILACDRAADTPHEPGSRWHSIVSTDPVDGSKKVQMMIGAVDRLPSQKDHAALVLSCDRGTTDAYVIWRQYLGVYDLEVSWRVGSEQAVTETWSLSTDNEATFAPEPVELIKRMMANKLFLIKTTPFGSSPVTVEFNTAGLQTESAELREACAW